MAVVKINAIEVAPERGPEFEDALGSSLLEFEVVQEVAATRTGA